MPVALQGLLKLCLLALVYLFFVRVLWAVWSEVRTPVSAAPPAPAAGLAHGADLRHGTHAPPNAGATGPAAYTSGDATGAPGARPLAASHLVVLAPEEQRGRMVSLAGELTVGRAATCTLPLADDSYLSSLHARVYEQDGATHVEDLGSTNGTWVNDERITDPVTVVAGDRIQVGGTVFEVA